MNYFNQVHDKAKKMGMNNSQAKIFTFIVASEKAKEQGNSEAHNYFEMRLIEMGAK